MYYTLLGVERVSVVVECTYCICRKIEPLRRIVEFYPLREHIENCFEFTYAEFLRLNTYLEI